MLLALLRKLLLAWLAALAGGCALQAVPTHQVRWEPIAPEPVAALAVPAPPGPRAADGISSGDPRNAQTNPDLHNAPDTTETPLQESH